MPEKRVGSYTMGISLIAFGILYLIRSFTGLLDYRLIVKFWPLVLVCFGIELLVTNSKKSQYKYKFDFLSLIATFGILGISMCMAGLEFIIEEFPQCINF